eukprot:TRINITY_DN9300_c0_g1_i4.p1 TRINITY_DN9300_c0_g1~~TRINITY_DN9300_c0_g1_i4.p1  ORF type:complete len:231 (+),score=53.74 TRINITY_DN9300_c0_g1_i4:651-1343(+)
MQRFIDQCIRCEYGLSYIFSQREAHERSEFEEYLRQKTERMHMRETVVQENLHKRQKERRDKLKKLHKEEHERSERVKSNSILLQEKYEEEHQNIMHRLKEEELKFAEIAEKRNEQLRLRQTRVLEKQRSYQAKRELADKLAEHDIDMKWMKLEQKMKGSEEKYYEFMDERAGRLKSQIDHLNETIENVKEKKQAMEQDKMQRLFLKFFHKQENIESTLFSLQSEFLNCI